MYDKLSGLFAEIENDTRAVKKMISDAQGTEGGIANAHANEILNQINALGKRVAEARTAIEPLNVPAESVEDEPEVSEETEKPKKK